MAQKAKVNMIPGYDGEVLDEDEAVRVANDIGEEGWFYVWRSLCGGHCVEVIVWRSLYGGHCMEVIVWRSLCEGQCVEVIV